MRSRTGILIVFAVGAAATGAVAAFPEAEFAYRRPAMQIALETAAALIAFVAALLVFGRFRQRGRLDELFLFAALCVLSATNLLFSAIPAATAQTLFGSFTTWAPLIGRLISALLLAVSAVVPPHPLKSPGRSVVIVGAGLVGAMVFVAHSVAMLGDTLPRGVVPGSAMATELAEESRILSESPIFVAPLVAPLASIENLSTHPLLSGAQLVAMALYVFAAVGFSAARDQHDEFRGWLALGGSFAALSALNYALFPSLYTDYVYTGDVFRLFFYLVLLIGAARVIAAYWRNLALVAVLEERGRVARDLHDGLAQELAFITRRARRASQNDDDGGMTQIAAAAQRALVDSRLVIAALTRPIDEPLEIALARSVEDAAARSGARVEVDLAPGVDVTPEVREAVIRIATEAVSNAARHAPGALIRVELRGEPLRLCVRDEGEGFDPDAVTRTTHSGFGLTSMRERAKALGAEFKISSAPGQGTEVEMVMR